MTEQDLRAARAAQNQALFRNVNERLLDLNAGFEAMTDRSVFVCECADIACIEQIDMKLEEYQRVRSNPRRFVVAPSEAHVVPDVENVVAETPNYFVVEKVGVASEIVEAAAEQQSV